MSNSRKVRERAVEGSLWFLQLGLGMLFLFAGWSKLAMPLDVMVEQSGLPGSLLRFIGLAEMAGGAGLILPGLLRIHRQLTPAAAVGLAVIMVGAVVLSLPVSPAAAMLPLVVGAMLVTVVAGRRTWAVSIS